MTQREFHVEGIGVVTVQKRRGNRSLRLTIGASGIRVSIPAWSPYSAGLAFVRSKQAWIAANAAASDRPLQTGQVIGRTRCLSLVSDAETRGIRTSVRAKEVVVWYGEGERADSPMVQRAAERASWRALKAESTATITLRLNELAVLHGFSYRSLRFKRMTSRWGSCDQHSNLVFTIFLVQLPDDCIDYVILHELTHTRVLHHGPDFWLALENVLPGARSFKRTMRSYHPTIMASPLANR